MKRHLSLLPILFILASCEQSETPYTTMPAANAVDVCPDTHITLTFHQTPQLSDSGMIRILDVATFEVVDSLDMSIPAGPTQSRTYGPECGYTQVPYDYTRSIMPTNLTVKPGTPSGTAVADTTEYQLNIIGGFTDGFHFHPVIIHDSVATIYPHNNVLQYDHTYKVLIDAGVFSIDSAKMDVITWRFSTRQTPPTGETLHVDALGKGDFCTVQGALDFVPDHADKPYYIVVAPGDYEEIVYARNKDNVHITGSGMQETHIHYANNEVFNPHPMNVKTNEWPGTFPSRRAAFALDNCNDCTLAEMTIGTDLRGQAEGLLLNGERLYLNKVGIVGSGDAMQANGTIYLDECEMDGDGDTFLGRGAIFAYRCHLRNDGGPYTWIRNTAGHHGDVFVECDLTARDGRPVDFGRCPSNHGTDYPYAEQVMINCRVDSVIPEGWSAIGEKTATFLEYNTTNIQTGKPVDVSKRHPYSRQLDAEKDSILIMQYQNPAFVLNGWNPKR